ncbi:MAG: T9SS type A sorting domain-containing protein, partial [Flavobacteriales bacterium]
GANTILNQAMNFGSDDYSMAQYTDGPDDENMIFFNTSKLGFVRQNEIQVSPRQINEYVLYHKNPALNSIGDTTYFYFYACHLKASDTSTDAAERAAAAAVLKSYLSLRPNPENTIVGGDMNIYGSSELAYVYFTGETQANLFDPMGSGEYNNNSSFAGIHTQSTRIENFDGGSIGGLDDRFDMMLMSDDLRYGLSGAQFVQGSYRAIGQDGNHFNESLISPPANNSEPIDVINALYFMSDHLPIFMELEIVVPSWVSSFAASSKLSISPNPSSGKFKIFSGPQGFNNAEIRIIDGMGEIVFTETGVVIPAGGSHEVNESLSSGVYLVRIEDESGVSNARMIIH